MTKDTKGVIRFKSSNFKYSFKISNGVAAQVLGYIAQTSDNPITHHSKRDKKGRFTK